MLEVCDAELRDVQRFSLKYRDSSGCVLRPLIVDHRAIVLEDKNVICTLQSSWGAWCCVAD